jgi:hypothetical protein
MSDKTWDAYFSQKMLVTCGSYNIYADAEGNNFACLNVMDVGKEHTMKWDDVVYLGQVVKHVRRVIGTSIPDGVRISPLPQLGAIYKSPWSLQETKAAKPEKAINDYVCPGCRNDKCSKTEKSCWKCGFQFSVNK